MRSLRTVSYLPDKGFLQSRLGVFSTFEQNTPDPLFDMEAIMGQPAGFSWIEKPLLAALARPTDVEDLQWLHGQGIQLLVTLTEDRLRRDWVDEAGLLVFHVPMVDM